MKRTALNRYTPLKPGGPLKAGGPLKRTKLAPESAKAKATRAAGPVNPAGPVCCLACGRHDNLSRSHVLTRKQFPQHALNPANLVWLCIWPCHSSWENNKQEFRRNHPAAWNVKLAAMRKLNRSYYALFCLKHGGPSPTSYTD